ncbi:MAG: zf-HC2 domain-containing protein [Gemmatimonadota bacterium]|nr:MAG: zf-HC2 domain-containing protein [Gemmatimonadota bacterium]
MSHIEEAKLHAYLDGACAERELERIEAHLASCGECQAQLAAAVAASRIASDLLAEIEPQPVHAPPWREIEERAATRSRSAPSRSWVRPSLAWAAMIAIAFGVGWLSNTYYTRAPERLFTGSRQAEAPVAAADALEQERFEQAPAEELPGAAAGQRSAETTTPETQAEIQDLDRLRMKSADERLAAELQPGRTELAEGAARETDREGVLGAVARKRVQEAEPVAEKAAEDVVAATPPTVAGVEANRAEPELRVRRDAPADQARPETEPLADFAAQRSVLQSEAGETAAFFSVQPEDAALWLDAELRRLPDLQLRRVEVGPGSAVQGGLPGLPAVKLVYEDAAGHEYILVQQRVADATLEFEEAEPVLTVDPDGQLAYRWLDGRGYRLILIADVSSDSLRALAERVR